jgi:sulfur-carrier protein
MIRVLFFGRLGDLAGEQRSLPAPSRLSLVLQILRAQDEALGNALADGGVRAAVNHVIVPRGDDPELHPGDELAFMPPLSGG